MRFNKELVGLKLEIFGLLLVLTATLWQGSFTDWFDRNNQNSIAYAQETVNLAVLASIKGISTQISTSDPTLKKSLDDQIHDGIAHAYSEAVAERDRRLALQTGQASIFGRIRYALLLLGAALVIFGKWLVHSHKAVADRASTPDRERR